MTFQVQRDDCERLFPSFTRVSHLPPGKALVELSQMAVAPTPVTRESFVIANSIDR